MDKQTQLFIEPDDLTFNPNEYTEKELLKLVYRELHVLRTEFDDYRKNNTWEKRISNLEADLTLQKTLREISEKRTTRLMAYVGLAVTAVAAIMRFVIK